jgi:hypothetical protein
MDWIKQNKFLAGFIAVLVIAGGALGFLAFSAKGAYETTYADYQTKASELNRLQTQQPYPDDANVAKMQGVQKEHQAAIDALQKDLLKAQIPLKPLTPEKFQDNLRESVRRVTAKAAEKSVKVPEDFYMGFPTYQGTPPKPEAAAPLGRMLEAMELAVTNLFETNISELTEIRRDNLPEEGIASNTPEPPKGSQRGRDEKDKGKDKDTSLAKRISFYLTFVAAEPSFRNFLNSLIQSKQQFFVPNTITVANQADKGPSKAELGPGTPPPPPPPLDPPAPGNPPSPAPPAPTPGAPARKFVVGEEKLTITMRIDIVEFAEPVASKK